MSKKLIAFDLDGTLLGNDKRVSQHNKQIIQQLQAKGHFVTIATGRNYLTSERVIKETGIPHYVLCNGSYAFVNHQLTYENALNKQELQKLRELCHSYELDIVYHGLKDVKKACIFFDEHLEERMWQYYKVKLTDGVDFENEAIYQATIYAHRRFDALLEQELNLIRMTRWDEEGMDAIPVQGSKAVTLQFLAEKENISRENIITFGDGENDIEMLQLAGVGVAMGNASDLVKQFADTITATNEENGIYLALKELEIL